MRIVITGGAGFIGCNFIRYELSHYIDDIICIDSLTYAGSLDNLKDVKDNPKFTFVKADITDKETIDSIFKEYKPDIVINFAAESHVDNSIQNPDLFTKTNVLGTQVLMDACLKYGVKRFHQVSTDEVYGYLPLGSKDFFTESSTLKPSSPYAASKASADLMVLAYVRTYGLNATITRSSNNYGPYQHSEKFIPVVIDAIQNKKDIPVYGDGSNIRNWIYVEDNCIAIDLVVRKGEKANIYNICSDTDFSNLDLINAISKTMNKDAKIKFVQDRKGHDLRYSMLKDKIGNELNWFPKFSFDEGMQKTVSWYLEKM